MIKHHGFNDKNSLIALLKVTHASRSLCVILLIHCYVYLVTEWRQLKGNSNWCKRRHFQISEGFVYEIEEVTLCLDKAVLESNEYQWHQMLLNVRIRDEIRKQIGLEFK
eukprot:69289_1